MMTNSSAFFDLCIQESFFAQEDVEKSIRILYDLGYRTIAVNQIIEDGNIEPKKKKKKGEPRENQEVVPQPYDLSLIEEVIKKLDLNNFQVLNRLTVVFSNQDVLHKITKSPNYKKFHLLAVTPTTMQALTYVCGNLEADIFAYNPENKFSLRLNRKLYTQLADKGYHFELLYSAAIEDSSKRKNLIHASHLYFTYGKSRNVIFSSGASSSILLRSPYDVVNFGFLFGLSELKCKMAVSFYPKNLLLNSVGRRHGKAVMFVENVSAEKPMEVIEISASEDDDDEEDDDIDMSQPKHKRTKV